MILIEVREPWQRQLFADTINRFHTYVDYKDTCNRRINWLVMSQPDMGEVLGAVGVNSAILALGVRDRFIGWQKEQRIGNLTMVANNYRFAMIDKGQGGVALNEMCRIAPAAWQKKYGDQLVLLETLVKPPYKGTVYLANGWQKLGMTTGHSISKAPVASWQKEKGARGELARRDPEAACAKYAVGRKHYAVTESEPKIVLVRPLVRGWKNMLCKVQRRTGDDQSQGEVQSLGTASRIANARTLFEDA